MGVTIAQISIDDSSDKVISGQHSYDRGNGGILIPPSGSALPSTGTQPGEWFWLTTTDTLYRRNDANDAWVPQVPTTVPPHASSHQNGGPDQLNVNGLSGVLSDDQPVQAHAIDGAKHTGLLPHASLSGVGTDDHHSQLHASSHARGNGDVVVRQPELINVRESNNGQSFAPTGTIIEFDTTTLNTAADVFQRNGSTEIEFLIAGVIEAHVKVSVRQTAGGGRTISYILFQNTTDGGLNWNVVSGTAFVLYTRNSTDGNYGSLASTVRMAVAAGERLRVFGARLSGTGTIALMAEGSNWGITWHPA